MKIKTHGELLVDHRATGVKPPGVPPIFESAIATCSHCQAAVIMNPLRTRERAVCKKCMAYVCDQCAAAMALSGVCKTFEQVVDETLEAATLGRPLPGFNPY